MAKKIAINTEQHNKIPSLILEYCSEEWLPFIEYYIKKISYSKGEYIFKEGDEVKGIKLIDTGKVKVVSSYDKTSEKIIRLAGDGVFIGHRGFGSGKKYPVSAVALCDTIVTFIPDEVFYTILKANSRLSFYLLNFFADELRNSEQESKNQVRYTAKQRIVYAILNTIKAFGYDKAEKKRLGFTPSRQDFASLASTTYETVIRTLSELDKQKIIQLEGKQIRIIDLGKLKDILSE